jgi:serine/threonine-protein kinase
VDDYERKFIESLRGERIGGRYLVERVLGAGGMGMVAAARYPELGQQVAIKFMRAELAADSTLSARFLREARLAARAKSPHFVRVFDFGRLSSGVPYLVMEMLRGRDLGAELEERGALPVETAIDYLLQAMIGIAEIHALGVVHRDLKPSNLFLAEAAGTRTIKVLDLGLSKESAAGLTTTGHSFGTPHYMSPEQIRESKSVDPRSDLWALGVILYELLTNTVPIGEACTATGEVFGQVLHTDPVPLRQRRPELPAALEAVIGKCLRRNPAERFTEIAEIAEALRPFAGTASVGRVDAVREALATRPDAEEDPAVVGVQPTVVADPVAHPGTTASPKRAPAAAAPAAERRDPAPSEMVAVKPSAVSAYQASLESRRPSRAWIVVATLVAVLGGVMATFIAVRATSHGTPAASPGPGASALPSVQVPEPAPLATTVRLPEITSSVPVPAQSASATRELAPAHSAVHRAAPAAASRPSGGGTSLLDGLDRK